MPCRDAIPPLVLLSAVLTPLSLSAAPPPLFTAPWRAFDTGDFPTFAPTAFALGDLDGDQDLDIVAAREMFSGPGLSVLFNVGDGAFAQEVIYELPFSHDLGDVALADFDSDQDLDAVATIPGNAGTDLRIALWRNNGDGTFGAPEMFLTGLGPVGIAVADFTGDGYPDVITADNGYVAGTNDTISLLVHNGDTGRQAGFLPPVQFPVGDNSTRLAAGDLDGDLDIDVVVGRGGFTTNNASGLSVLFNDGSGAFGPATHYSHSAYRHSPAVALADLDNDHDLDLLGAIGEAGSPTSYGIIVIRHNDGTGVFGPPQTLFLPAWTFTPHTITTADLNDDDWLDIIASTPSGRANDGYNVLLSNGSGGFLPPVRYEAAKQTYDLATLDTDDDGDLDVLALANDSSVVTVHKNLGDGTFLILPRYPVGWLTDGMDSGDLDHDGDLDIVVSDGSVRILWNNGDGTFPPHEEHPPPMDPGSIKLRHLNGDTFLDILIGPDRDSPPYNFATSLNNGNGTFAPWLVTIVGASQAGDVEALDLDNDLDLDVGICDPGPASAIYLFSNNGSGTAFTYRTTIGDHDGLPFGIDGGDLDHDGNVDIVTSNALGLTSYLGNGDFTFQPAFPSSTSGYPFALADLDGDGNLDLAFKGPEPSFGLIEVGTMLGFGDGGFAFPTMFPGPNGRESAFRISTDVGVFDINGDEKPDVILTNNAPNDICVFLAVGDGTLMPQDRYGVGYSASQSTFGDFTGNGAIDAAAVIGLPPSGGGGAVVVIEGIPTSPPRPGDVNGDGVVDVLDLLEVLGSWGPCPGCPADLNGDGVVDVLDLLEVLGHWG